MFQTTSQLDQTVLVQRRVKAEARLCQSRVELFGISNLIKWVFVPFLHGFNLPDLDDQDDQADNNQDQDNSNSAEYNVKQLDGWWQEKRHYNDKL